MKMEHLLLGLGALLLLKPKKAGLGAITYPVNSFLPDIIDDAGVNGKTIGTGTIVRSREINLRMRNGPFLGQDTFTSASHAADFLRKIIGRKMGVQEVFIAVFLNRSNRPIGYIIQSVGGISSTPVEIRIIAATALKALATGVIVAHNHPSGNPTPSDADRDITKKLKTALKQLDLILMDHIIVTADGYRSFMESRML